MKINIICLGKLKESFWREAEAEFLKRLGPFFKLEIHEIKEESFSEKNQPEKIKQKEAEKILAALESAQGGPAGDAFVIALDENGKQFSSIEFSKFLYEKNQDVVFVLGGPLGLDQSVLQKANLKLSFSKFTFTHQMCRVFLLEQIYRAGMITAGRRYHY